MRKRAFASTAFVAGLLALGVTAVSLASTNDLGKVDTAAFIFYFPNGFEPIPEHGGVFYGNKRGESINVVRFGYLAGRKLNEDLCKELAREFNRSDLREKAHASEAQNVTFKDEDGTRSCYYRYQFTGPGGNAHLEYKVYQGRNAYAVTAIHNENSPNQEALRQALHAFVTKTSVDLVIVDESKRAYTVFSVVPGDLRESQLEDLRSKVAKREGAQLLSWNEFLERKKKLLKRRVLKDEYPGSRAMDGIVELIGSAPGVPFGLTWNGGIALTYRDYQHATETYERYKEDPEEYERTRNRDPRLDPVNPKGHLGPLLGW